MTTIAVIVLTVIKAAMAKTTVMAIITVVPIMWYSQYDGFNIYERLEMLSIFYVMDAYGPNGSFGHNSCNGHFGIMV